MRGSRLAKLLMGLIVASALLAGAEAALRLLLGPPPPPVRVYRAIEDHERYFEVRDGEVRASYMRYDPVPPFPATSAPLRVAALGGSSVHAGSEAVGWAEEFPALIGEQIGFTVLNLGSPGLDSFDLLQMIEELSALDVDALLIYTGHNDLGNALFERRYGTVRSGLAAHARSRLGHLQLYCQLARLLQPPVGSPRRWESGRIDTPRSRPLPERQHQEALENLRINLRRIAWRTAQLDTPVVLVTPVSRVTRLPPPTSCRPEVPCATQLFREASRIRRTDPEAAVPLLLAARDADRLRLRAPTVVQEDIRQLAAEWPHITLVDAERDLPRQPDLDVVADRLFTDALHLSARGHIELARLAAPAVRSALQKR